jgi:hypothetical protein
MTVTRSLPAILFIAILIVIAGSLISTQDRASDAAQTKTIDGYLVDVACATDNAKTPTKDFGAIHTKDCMQMEDCAGTGFAVLTPDDKIIKFDSKSNQLARIFLQGSKKDKDFKVSVTGKLQGDKLSVESINLKD